MSTNNMISKCSWGFVLILLFSSGCIRYYKVAKTEFPQGEELEDKRPLVSDDVKSIAVYDQFATRGFFDVMMLSDTVRSAYVDLYCARRGLTGDAKDTFIKSYEDRYKGVAMFCVLASVRDREHANLHEKDSAWSIFIDLGDGKKLIPTKISRITPDPEITKLFEPASLKFKKAYEVAFDMPDDEETLKKLESRDFKFVISSVDKYCELAWLEKNGGKINEDFYWI